MRVFIAFDGLCEPFDILPGQTVQEVKQMIKDAFHIQISDDRQGRRFLELQYAGGVLRDDWVLADVGITVCSTIKCFLKEEDKPALYVYNAVTNERVPVMGGVYLMSTTVSRLKTIMSLKCGFPVSVFCLRTLEGKDMYNCNILSDYKLDLGSTIRMDVWDGWKEFLNACVLGHKQKVQCYLSKEDAVLRYQQRVALYLAAYFGHLELAEWLQKRGVRADEAIGVHPYREWCSETDHPDTAKCAIHAAAEAGQLLLLKAFISHNILCLQCQNPMGQTPLRICIQQRHKDCVLYLVMKMWSLVSFPKISLPMSVYIKVKRWLFTAQKAKSAAKNLRWLPVFKTRVGDPLVVDGFTEPKMRSRGLSRLYQDSWNKIMRTCNYPGTQNGQTLASTVLKLHASSKRENTGQANILPPLNKTAKPTVKRSKVEGTSTPGILEYNRMAQVPLPPIANNCNSFPRHLAVPQAAFLLNSSLESFSKHTGKTPRENAIYCLGLASQFKEKPWLQQLDMARMLAKKTVYSL
ncbi:protein ANKUB1 [Spea bombifrons]|uniref:protein ANKUB1 n=1 Tax=Spea bombifrons TaxID=233779 RepID=UPI00234A9771|nr:protein ANKUB1 [Spea bombifrons]